MDSSANGQNPFLWYYIDMISLLFTFCGIAVPEQQHDFSCLNITYKGDRI